MLINSLVPSLSYTKREKGSGEKGGITVSIRNAIIGILVCIRTYSHKMGAHVQQIIAFQ